MKKIYLLALVFSNIIYANCEHKPSSDKIKIALDAKNHTQAEKLLHTFREEIESYKKECDTSKDMHEELHVLLLEYTDHLKDLKEDMHKQNIKIDCSKIPSNKKLEEAFKSKDTKAIKSLYPLYKKSSHQYIKHCASHSAYEELYEASMLCEERYNEWKKKL